MTHGIMEDTMVDATVIMILGIMVEVIIVVATGMEAVLGIIADTVQAILPY